MIGILLILVLLVTERKCETTKLIWISIDAFKHDVLTKEGTHFLKRVSNSGVHVKKMHPMFVSKTFPNHFSAITGLTVEEHGVIANSIHDKKLGFVNMTTISREWWDPNNTTLPIWTLVEQNGGKAAVVYWPGGPVKFGGIYPSFYHRVYNSSCDAQCRIEESVKLYRNNSFDLIMIYLGDFDKACHKEGPDSIAAQKAISYIDSALEYFIDQIKDSPDFYKTSIMIGGDHGMSTISNDRAIILDQILKYLNNVEMVQQGPVAMFNCIKSQCTLLIDNLKSYSHINFVGYVSDLPLEFHYSNNERIPDVIAIMEDGWVIKDKNISWGKGEHGYPWQWADSMDTQFIGFNGKFNKKREFDEIFITDLFSIACAILNLESKCKIKGNIPIGLLDEWSLYKALIPVVSVVSIICILIMLGILNERYNYTKKIRIFFSLMHKHMR